MTFSAVSELLRQLRLPVSPMQPPVGNFDGLSPAGRFLLWLAAVGAVLWAVVRFLFQPITENWLFRTIESNPERFDAACAESWKRGNDPLKQRMEAFESQLEFIQASLLSQGKELQGLPRLADALQENAKAITAMTLTMGSIQSEIALQGKAIARIEGNIEAWDGTERRNHQRRKST